MRRIFVNKCLTAQCKWNYLIKVQKKTGMICCLRKCINVLVSSGNYTIMKSTKFERHSLNWCAQRKLFFKYGIEATQLFKMDTRLSILIP